MKIKNITWETDGEEVELPTAVGDGEFVEVYDTEVENFNILGSK